MLHFKLKNLSGFLSLSEFFVHHDSMATYHIKEITSSPFKRFISFTRLRMLLSLELDMLEIKSNKGFRLTRKVSFPYNSYILKGEDDHTIVSFEPKKRGWRWLPIGSLLSHVIKDSHGRIIGITLSKNPFIIGPQYGEVKDLAGQTIATFEWKRFSLWRGYRECELMISRHDENWVLISIVAALIKGLYLQQR